MKKMIVIEEESTKNNLVKNKIVNFVISLVCYGVVLILVSMIFKDFYINNKYFGVYALLAAFIIDILNKTIKPILVVLTLPITTFSMGMLYPIVNVIILYMTSFIMGNNFNVGSFWTAFFASILISIFNIFMDGLVIKPITKEKD